MEYPVSYTHISISIKLMLVFLKQIIISTMKDLKVMGEKSGNCVDFNPRRKS